MGSVIRKKENGKLFLYALHWFANNKFVPHKIPCSSWIVSFLVVLWLYYRFINWTKSLTFSPSMLFILVVRIITFRNVRVQMQKLFSKISTLKLSFKIIRILLINNEFFFLLSCNRYYRRVFEPFIMRLTLHIALYLRDVWNPYSKKRISHSIILNYAYWCLFAFSWMTRILTGCRWLNGYKRV